MKWSAENRRFEFSPHPGQEPLITWTPVDGPTFPTSTESPIQKIDQPTILVTPVPEHGETTTPPFPVPDPQDINDWILTFPDNPGYAPIYVLLSERLRGKELHEAAKKLGYPTRVPPQKVPFNSHGQPAFTNGKDYITPDVDGHNVSDGWKLFNKKGTRVGTYDFELNHVKG